MFHQVGAIGDGQTLIDTVKLSPNSQIRPAGDVWEVTEDERGDRHAPSTASSDLVGLEGNHSP
jgi:hypothetical protein